jgi:hypothetical protein
VLELSVVLTVGSHGGADGNISGVQRWRSVVLIPLPSNNIAQGRFAMDIFRFDVFGKTDLGLDLDRFADFDPVSVWFLAFLAAFEKLHYRFGGPEEIELLSEWRLLRSGKRPDGKIWLKFWRLSFCPNYSLEGSCMQDIVYLKLHTLDRNGRQKSRNGKQKRGGRKQKTTKIFPFKY